ncbi:MAG: XdhC family protein [Gemmatimonadetes bacterium]|nr:XdhC family protein [Gemmatimonadota bacterium]
MQSPAVKRQVPPIRATSYITPMSLLEIRDAVAEWMARDHPWGEAALVGVKRSAPRPPGARFAVGQDGSFAGTISAGCVEADLREHLLSMLGQSPQSIPRFVSYGISDEMAAGVGLSCGGEIEVLIRRHEPQDPVWSDLLDLLDLAAAGSRQRAYGALVTGLSEGVLGRQVLVRADGSKTGSLGDPALDRAVEGERDHLFSREGAEALPLGSGHRVFVERILPPRRLVIIGATPIAVSLSALASRVGYHVTIVDPREGLARPSLFPDADVVQNWPAEALSELNAAEWTDVAVLAHSERLDVPALRGAIEAGCRYVGLLGGRRTQEARRAALEAAGVPASGVSRIRGPIGLDIGAVSPREIAVAILAEMLAVRLGKADT